jgi:hypothetical protein
MISVCSMVRHAASSAAATTKSVTVRPWISAARFNRASTGCGSRASSRAVVGASCFMLQSIYGGLPYVASLAIGAKCVALVQESDPPGAVVLRGSAEIYAFLRKEVATWDREQFLTVILGNITA